MILNLAQQAAEQATASGIDWQGIALVITALGGIVTAVLQAMGKAKAASEAKRASQQAVAMVRGIEQADKAFASGDHTALIQAIKATAGVEVGPKQVEEIAHAYQAHVKKSVKQTAMAMNVEDLLSDLVASHTKRLNGEELRKRLEAERAQDD